MTTHSIEIDHISAKEAERLLREAAIYLRDRARYAEAEPLFLRTLRIREQQLGAEHPDMAYPLYNLANLYRRQGKYAEAEPLYRRALHIREKAFGAHHPKTTETRRIFIALLHSMERSEEAAQLEAVQTDVAFGCQSS